MGKDNGNGNNRRRGNRPDRAATSGRSLRKRERLAGAAASDCQARRPCLKPIPRACTQGGRRQWLWEIPLFVGPAQPLYARIQEFLELTGGSRVFMLVQDERATLYFEELEEAATFLDFFGVAAATPASCEDPGRYK